jgi:ribosomal 30S subunit maturation factor RimM
MTHDILVNITEFVHTDMPVYDRNEEKIGTVKQYHADAGYLLVEKRMPVHKDLYIPFQIIRTIDPKEIFLKQPKDAVEREYTQPPTLTVEKEQFGERVKETSVVKSGFDDRPIVVNRVDVQEIVRHIKPGMAVYDVMGERIGKVTQYDSTHAVMTVEHGVFSPTVLFIPFSLVQQIYSFDDQQLTLTVPKDILQKDMGRYTTIPAS